jgi:hypothetical protein
LKTTGVLWKAYVVSWPDGQWFVDSDVTVNGKDDDDVELINDDDLVEFAAGVVFATSDDREGKPLTRHFNAWMNAQNTVTTVCDVPKDKLDALKAAVKALGGRVRI